MSKVLTLFITRRHHDTAHCPVSTRPCLTRHASPHRAIARPPYKHRTSRTTATPDTRSTRRRKGNNSRQQPRPPYWIVITRRVASSPIPPQTHLTAQSRDRLPQTPTHALSFRLPGHSPSVLTYGPRHGPRRGIEPLGTRGVPRHTQHEHAHPICFPCLPTAPPPHPPTPLLSLSRPGPSTCTELPPASAPGPKPAMESVHITTTGCDCMYKL